MAREGRRKGLKIIKEGKLVSLRDWAHNILDEMSVLSNISGQDNNNLDHYKDIISNPGLSISGMLLDTLVEKNISFQDMGIELAQTYKEEFLQLKPSENIYWDALKEEALASLKKQDVERVYSLFIDVLANRKHSLNHLAKKGLEIFCMNAANFLALCF